MFGLSNIFPPLGLFLSTTEWKMAEWADGTRQSDAFEHPFGSSFPLKLSENWTYCWCKRDCFLLAGWPSCRSWSWGRTSCRICQSRSSSPSRVPLLRHSGCLFSWQNSWGSAWRSFLTVSWLLSCRSSWKCLCPPSIFRFFCVHLRLWY